MDVGFVCVCVGGGVDQCSVTWLGLMERWVHVETVTSSQPMSNLYPKL